MPEPDPRTASPGLAATLRAGVNAGATVGTLAGLFDGGLRTLGIDPGLFLHRLRAQGLGRALSVGLPEWGEVPGLAGCTAAAALVYALGGALAMGLLGAALHPRLGAVPPERRFERLAGLALGIWIFAELYWGTRAVLFSGLSATHPTRLAAGAALLAVSLVGGGFLPRLRVRLPRRLRLATPLAVVVLGFTGAAYLLLDAGGGSQRGRINPRNRDLPNVLLVIVDALRQDVLGCYGSGEVDTPNLDRLAREGVLFENALVQAPFTWTSFGSFLTGKYPRRHGLLRMAPGYALPPNVTLPFYLKTARRADGVALEETDVLGAAILTGTLSTESGLARGFDVYFEGIMGHELVDVHRPWSEFRSGLLPWLYWSKLAQRLESDRVVGTAVRWLRANGQRRWIALVHLYSTHTTYDPPARWRERYCDPDYRGPLDVFGSQHRIAIERGDHDPSEADVAQIRALYRGGVSEADEALGRLLAELEGQGVLDDTIVVLTSDHGESLGEHGLWEHNHMYQDNLLVPLILRWPRALPSDLRVTARVDSIDLFPTLVELMGLEPRPHASALQNGASTAEALEVVDGVSLLAVIRGEARSVRPYSFAESGRFLSVQDQRHKLVMRRELLADGAWEGMLAAPAERWLEPAFERPRFFDLERDPLELENLFTSARAGGAPSSGDPGSGEPGSGEVWQRIAELHAALVAWSDSLPVRAELYLQSARDREDQAALMRALGYAGGVGLGEDELGEHWLGEEGLGEHWLGEEGLQRDGDPREDRNPKQEEGEDGP